MERPTGDRVDLDALDQDRPGLLAIDRQVDQGVLSGLAAQELEVMKIDGDAGRLDAMAEDDAGLARAAERGDLLADDVARLGRERGTGRRGGGHVSVEPQVWGVASRATLKGGRESSMSRRSSPLGRQTRLRQPSSQASTSGQPALLERDPRRFGSVPRADLLDRGREVVADGAPPRATGGRPCRRSWPPQGTSLGPPAPARTAGWCPP